MSIEKISRIQIGVFIIENNEIFMRTVVITFDEWHLTHKLNDDVKPVLSLFCWCWSEFSFEIVIFFFNFLFCLSIRYTGSRLGIRDPTSRMGKGRLGWLWDRIDDADKSFCSNINNLSYNFFFTSFNINRMRRGTNGKSKKRMHCTSYNTRQTSQYKQQHGVERRKNLWIFRSFQVRLNSTHTHTYTSKTLCRYIKYNKSDVRKCIVNMVNA